MPAASIHDMSYKLKVIAYAEEHRNKEAEQHFGPPPTEKTICGWRASKGLEKNDEFQGF